ncbi:hypothetical protein KC345_g282 [Hortaea werneckii]|nr:hypothetical protein KC345_g282 [Hortaea werneckii]
MSLSNCKHVQAANTMRLWRLVLIISCPLLREPWPGPHSFLLYSFPGITSRFRPPALTIPSAEARRLREW